jgi:hypothetical protein
LSGADYDKIIKWARSILPEGTGWKRTFMLPSPWWNPSG